MMKNWMNSATEKMYSWQLRWFQNQSYLKMIGLLVKSTITTSHSKKTPYEDKTEDYISLEDIDHVEVQLL